MTFFGYDVCHIMTFVALLCMSHYYVCCLLHISLMTFVALWRLCRFWGLKACRLWRHFITFVALLCMSNYNVFWLLRLSLMTFVALWRLSLLRFKGMSLMTFVAVPFLWDTCRLFFCHKKDSKILWRCPFRAQQGHTKRKKYGPNQPPSSFKVKMKLNLFFIFTLLLPCTFLLSAHCLFNNFFALFTFKMKFLLRSVKLLQT